MGRGKYRKISYQPFLGSGGVLLPPNQAMQAGQFIKSENGRFILRLRSDGNLVLEDGGTVIWIADESQPYSSTFRQRAREPLQFVVSNSGFYMILSESGYGPLSPQRHWINPTGKITISR